MGSSTGVAVWDNGGGAAGLAALRLSDAVPSLFTPVSSSFKVGAFGAGRYPTMPFADFCHAVKAGFPAFSRCRFRVGDTWQISRGKTRILPRIDAGFTKCSPFADGGLGGHVPTGPGCISLAGRSGARRACPSPVTNSPQDCLCTGSPCRPPRRETRLLFASHKQSSGLFVYGLSLISGFCSSSRDFALGLPTAPRLAATHLPFG